MQLERRERYWVDQLKPELNMIMPRRTKAEYCQDNKEIMAEKRQEYYNKNKEVIIEKAIVYHAVNKERILAIKAERLDCDCGVTYTRGNTRVHTKTSAHAEYLKYKNVVADFKALFG
jgi:hypothetical protein